MNCSCGAPSFAKGMCERCYHRQWRDARRIPKPPVPTICVDCGGAVFINKTAQCKRCYMHSRWLRISGPKPPRPTICKDCGAPVGCYKTAQCNRCYHRTRYIPKGKFEHPEHHLARSMEVAYTFGRMTCAEIGRKLNISRERVRQVLTKQNVPKRRADTEIYLEARARKTAATKANRISSFRDNGLSLLLARTERTTGGCLLWTGPTSAPKKYPHIRYPRTYGYDPIGSPKKRPTYAYRLVYLLTKGEIPEGMTADHICWNPLCCNPDHLQLLTLSENAARKSGRWHKAQSDRVSRPRRVAA